jgi:hypothetical protein
MQKISQTLIPPCSLRLCGSLRQAASLRDVLASLLPRRGLRLRLFG